MVMQIGDGTEPVYSFGEHLLDVRRGIVSTQ